MLAQEPDVTTTLKYLVVPAATVGAKLLDVAPASAPHDEPVADDSHW
jgi:hypothetical protein